jgi:hypothetical protein
MKRVIGLLLLFLSHTYLIAQPLAPEDVPEPLKPWAKWVLYGESEYQCPFVYTSFMQRTCAWPSELSLVLSDKQGRFSQQWQVYQETWITLPGDQQHWPQAVMLNEQPALVIARQQRPVIRLKPGRYHISGEFFWDRLPEALHIPSDTGLVSLTVNNKSVQFPDLAQDGRLWLRERDTGNKAEGERDKLELQVFRQLIDEMPMQVVTRLQLDVAGAQREVLLGPVLLPDMIPLSLNSRLPARLEPDGHLRVQLRPGNWTIELATRSRGDTTSLPLPAVSAPWPQQEVWVFAARNHLRLVEVEGVSVDPRQTSLPDAWQSLPAYLMHANDTLRLKVIRRGDPEPEPDKLSLHRTLWLDFNGKGYTLHDKITGNMTRGWRLETQPGIELGRVDIDGVPQFITHLPGSSQQGVEVRRGAINLSADSRFTARLGRIPATGWDQDFYRVSAEMNLPPGWMLFSASGVDNVPQTWLHRWTLLDLFLVLILSLAILRLWNWRWGLIALVTLTLIWHQGLAPQFVWVNVLVAIALLRVVPKGKFHVVVIWYRNLSLLGLALIVIPFAVQQVRLGLYPQLERPWQSITPTTLAVSSVAPRRKAEVIPEAEAPRELKKIAPADERQDAFSSSGKSINLAQIDPNANVQTGPGLPQWHWTRIHLSWNGPVERQQQLDFILVPPVVNMLLNFLRVGLVLLLAALMFGVVIQRGKGVSFTNPFGTSAVILLCGLISVLGSMPQTAFAAETESKSTTSMPPPELLQQLKQRLLASPECLPECAQSPRMRLVINPDQLSLRMEIHAQQQVAVPLPSHAQQWMPNRVMVDGVAAQSLYRVPGAGLWVGLAPGRHQIELTGVLPARMEFSLPLPLTPHYVQVQADGWNIEGVHENGQADPQLQLTRLRSDGEQSRQAAFEPGALPPFVRVERTLHLGLEWQVETRVVRASPPGNPVVLEVPLLDGESPISPEGVRTKQNRVLVNMASNQSVYSWLSVLERQTEINLVAPDTTDWLEVWQVNVSPLWHIKAQGIPVVHHQDQQQNWFPEWRPWPGETVTLAITKPEGIDGKTLTIDDSQLHLKPGKRATDATFNFSLRSSQGGQHMLQLPDSARLQSVSINGVTQPIRQQGKSVTLPVVPGKQTYTLTWRTPQGMTNLYRTAAVNLGSNSTNISIKLNLGQDRWLIFTGGPRMGPAVLYWGVLIVLLLVALALGRVPLTPLKTWQWLLLGIGLSQVSLFMAAFIVIWLMLLGARSRLQKLPTPFLFDTMQIGLGLITIVALGFLFIAVQQGLLGTPEMHVSGNQSSAYDLNWYQDRSEAGLPQAWVLSMPLLVYRLLMLAWALWLAVSLLRWLHWGWQSFTTTAIWQHLEFKPRKSRKDQAAEQVTQPPAKNK